MPALYDFVHFTSVTYKFVIVGGSDCHMMREVFGTTKANTENHGREGRLALAMKYAKLCRLIARQGVIVVCSTISMFKEVYLWNRENQPSYFEVYLKVPLSELRKRDPKGIYKRLKSY